MNQYFKFKENSSKQRFRIPEHPEYLFRLDFAYRSSGLWGKDSNKWRSVRTNDSRGNYATKQRSSRQCV